MDKTVTIEALKRTGEKLAVQKISPMRVYLVGGAAGLLTGTLNPSRITSDCDAMEVDPDDQWQVVSEVAAEVGQSMQLKADWLSRDCRMYAWMMPLGWRKRCKLVNEFGPLKIFATSRGDLIAAKIMGAPKRPADLEDLQYMKPTRDELAKVREHIERLASESLDNETFEDQLGIVELLEATNEAQ